MRVAVERGVDGKAVQRPFEAARAEEREDLERLAFDGAPDRRVVQHGDLSRRAQPRECRLELHRLVPGFLHERLGGAFAPGAQGAAPEPAAETLHARKSYAVQLARLAVTSTAVSSRSP